MNGSDSVANASLAALARQAPNHLCWIVFSTLGLITNSLVILTIARSKSLRNKSQHVILWHAVAELALMAAFLAIGWQRYSSFLRQRPATSGQFHCLIQQFPLVLTGPLIVVFSLALAMDRFLCLAFPLFYKGLCERRYLWVVNALCWAYAIVLALLGFAYYDRTTITTTCRFVSIFHPTYARFHRTAANVIVSLTACTYALSACILYHRYRKHQLTRTMRKSKWRRRMELDVFLSIAVIGAIYLACSGTATVLTAVINIAMDKARILVPFISMSLFASSCSHLFVYLWLNPKFRKAFVQLFKGERRC